MPKNTHWKKTRCPWVLTIGTDTPASGAWATLGDLYTTAVSFKLYKFRLQASVTHSFSCITATTGYRILSSCQRDDQNLASQLHPNRLVSDMEQMAARYKFVASRGNGKPYIQHCANEHIISQCVVWKHVYTSHCVSAKRMWDYSQDDD